MSIDIASSHPSATRSWLQLLRASNVFTAIADTLMATVVVSHELAATLPLLLVIMATVAFYLSGMVLNDWFDRDADARERPERPLPSGAISLAAAGTVGWGLLGLGVTLAFTCSMVVGSPVPAVFGGALAAAIVLYNSILKSTPFGPLAMGACRGLNILLALAVAGATQFVDLTELPWLIPLGMTIYIAGVTTLAKNEATTSRRSMLLFAIAIIVLGLATLFAARWQMVPPIAWKLDISGWIVLWLALTLFLSRRFKAALIDPGPRRVQNAVGYSLQNLIVIDAIFALAAGGPVWGCLILALLVPTVILKRTIRMT